MFCISVAIPLVSLCGCVSLIMTIISNTFYFHSYQEEEGLRGGKGGGRRARKGKNCSPSHSPSFPSSSSSP